MEDGRRRAAGRGIASPPLPPRRRARPDRPAPRPRRQVRRHVRRDARARPRGRPAEPGHAEPRSGASSCRRRSAASRTACSRPSTRPCVRDEAWRGVLGEVRERHRVAVAALALPDEAAAVHALHDALFGEVADLLHGVSLLRECTPRFRDAMISAGERASVPVVAAAFRAAGHAAVALDATAFVRTDDRFGEATVDTARDAPARPRRARRRLRRGPARRRRRRDRLRRLDAPRASRRRSAARGQRLHGHDPRRRARRGRVRHLDRRRRRALGRPARRARGVLAAAAELRGGRRAGPLRGQGAPPAHDAPARRGRHPAAHRQHDEPGGRGHARRAGRGRRGEARIKALTAVRGVALVRVVGASVLEVPDLAARVFAPLAEAGCRSTSSRRRRPRARWGWPSASRRRRRVGRRRWSGRSRARSSAATCSA